MSISYCERCDTHIDEDYNVEHFAECNVPLGWDVLEHNYKYRLLRKFDNTYWLDAGLDFLLPLVVDRRFKITLDGVLEERGLK